LTVIEEGFVKEATRTDVTLTILEDRVVGAVGSTAIWNPDASVSSGLSGAMLEGYFALALGWGTQVGQRIYLEWDKLQLMDVKNADISGYSGKDLVFRNTGKTTIKFK
jgi:hypothetical protein